MCLCLFQHVSGSILMSMLCAVVYLTKLVELGWPYCCRFQPWGLVLRYMTLVWC